MINIWYDYILPHRDPRTRCQDIPALNVDAFMPATTTTTTTTTPAPPTRPGRPNNNRPGGNRRPRPGRTFENILEGLLRELDENSDQK